MYPDQIQANRRKALIAVTILALVGLGIFGLVSLLNARGKLQVSFVTAPDQVTIKMNGVEVGKKAQVIPGTYTLVVEREGFKPYSQQVSVSTDSTKEFAIALSPQTDEARKVAQQEEKVYGEVEAIGGKRAQEEGKNFLNENPVIQYIPYKTGYYAIDYGRDDANNTIIQITASSPLGRKVALEKIRDWGFDPTDLRIEFLGFTNNLAADAQRNGVRQ